MNIDYDSEIKKAELARIKAETSKLNAELAHLEYEKHGQGVQQGKKFWGIGVAGLVQAVIGGVVAGALVAGFGLDHFLKISDLNEKSQKALIAEKEEIEKEKRKSEEESRQAITALRNEHANLKRKMDQTLKKITSLSYGSSGGEKLNREVNQLRAELERVRGQAESREAQLATDLKSLVQEREASVKAAEGTWFPVISSPYNKKDLLGRLEELSREELKYPVHIYETADKRGVSVYAVTLGGYLSKSAASERVAYARRSGIASDAYLWSSSEWGKNIMEKFR